MYCGNQANFSGLLSGTHFLGTNYQCMRRGIGLGKNLPYDDTYTQPHMPIDERKFYCGNSPVLPQGDGYFALGSPSKCQQIGIGIGKAQRAAMGPPAFMYFIRYILPYILFFLIIGVVFIVIYFTKPKFFTKKDLNTNKDIIDWSKFLPYYTVLCFVVAIIIWWFWKRFVRRWI